MTRIRHFFKPCLVIVPRNQADHFPDFRIPRNYSEGFLPVDRYDDRAKFPLRLGIVAMQSSYFATFDICATLCFEPINKRQK